MLDVIVIIIVILVIFSSMINITKKIMDNDNVSQTRSYEPDEQNVCKHEWHMLGIPSFMGIDIYCPICKKEKHVSFDTWYKMKIDKKYFEKTKEQE